MRAELPSAPAAERNFAPILGALKTEFAGSKSILELGSGTGQHAAGFAREMPWLEWQPSDLGSQLAAIDAWVRAAALANLRAPFEFDVDAHMPHEARYDGAFSANTAHIMSEASVERAFRLLGQYLETGARYCLYGPFREHGKFSTDSNARFDASLRQRDSAMGIRDMELLDDFAGEAGFVRIRHYAMPGNNLLVVYKKTSATHSERGREK